MSPFNHIGTLPFQRKLPNHEYSFSAQPRVLLFCTAVLQVPSVVSAKVCFLLSKLACKIALPLTSFSTLCCKSLFAISNLWITTSSPHMSKLSELYRCTIELCNTCSSNLSKLSTFSTELPRLPIELSKMYTCSTELSELFTCSIVLLEFFIWSTVLSGLFAYLTNLLGCVADLSTLLGCLAEFSLLFDFLCEFSTRLFSALELCVIVNNVTSSFVRLIVSSFLFSNCQSLAKSSTLPQLKHLFE